MHRKRREGAADAAHRPNRGCRYVRKAFRGRRRLWHALLTNGKVLSHDATGTIRVKHEGEREMPGQPETWKSVKATGPRSESYRPAANV